MSLFDSFTRFDVAYRTFPPSNISLEATILVPTTLISNDEHPKLESHSVPVMVHWHGGAFIVGHRMYEPWFAKWFLELALSRHAIVVTPDYRLLPEAKGDDVLDDVAHFWRWLRDDFPSVLDSELNGVKHLEPDLSRVICLGCSAGGVLAVLSGINLPVFLGQRNDGNEKEVKIQLVISVSAPLDISDPSLRIPRPRLFMGVRPPPPREAEMVVRNYIKAIQPGAIRTGCEPSAEMWRLVLCVAQQGYLPRFFEGGKGWDVKVYVEGVAARRDGGRNSMPPVWVVHSEGDTMIPSTCSTKFASLVEKILPDLPIRVDLPPGDHLFDVNMGLAEPWVKDGIEGFVDKHWI